MSPYFICWPSRASRKDRVNSRGQVRSEMLDLRHESLAGGLSSLVSRRAMMSAASSHRRLPEVVNPSAPYFDSTLEVGELPCCCTEHNSIAIRFATQSLTKVLYQVPRPSRTGKSLAWIAAGKKVLPTSRLRDHEHGKSDMRQAGSALLHNSYPAILGLHKCQPEVMISDGATRSRTCSKGRKARVLAHLALAIVIEQLAHLATRPCPNRASGSELNHGREVKLYLLHTEIGTNKDLLAHF